MDTGGTIQFVNGEPSDRDSGPLPPGTGEGAAPPPPTTDRERLVNRIVVAFVDGSRTRGFVYDVHMDRGDFHLYASDSPDETKAEKIQLARVKAIFFVRSLAGNPNYRENKTELTQRRRWGRPVEVVFSDGERMVGMVEIYHPEKRGFYLIPPDPRSNNLRIFVVASTVRSINLLDRKTGDGKDGTWEAPDPATYPLARRTEIVKRLLRDGNVDALSHEVFLPAAVLDHWKGVFTGAGREAITEEALASARARTADGEPPPPEKFDPTPLDRRASLVGRLLSRGDPTSLSQESLVPVRRLEEWRERFVEGGEKALRDLSGEEAAIAVETVRAKYEAIVVDAGTPKDARSDFLDSLTDLLDGLP
jgi:hypothetical protein